MAAAGVSAARPWRDQLAGDPPHVGPAHVDDQRRVRIDEARPVEVEAVVLLGVAGDEADAVRQAAMGQRNAGVGAAAGRRGDAGDDLEGDAGGGQSLRLLAAAAEGERIAALQPDDPAAAARQADQQLR